MPGCSGHARGADSSEVWWAQATNEGLYSSLLATSRCDFLHLILAVSACPTAPVECFPPNVPLMVLHLYATVFSSLLCKGSSPSTGQWSCSSSQPCNGPRFFSNAWVMCSLPIQWSSPALQYKPRSLPCTCLQAFPIIMLLSSSFPLVFSHAVVPCSPSLQVTCINISYHNGCLSLALVFLSWRSSPCLPALQGVHYYVFHSLHWFVTCRHRTAASVQLVTSCIIMMFNCDWHFACSIK